ncbi:hypothetical protein V2G26_013017 [Clonostachys chloroleuca]|uniref:Uncharacterized protein n=1 Tax=Clonostachys chloroleuca TaxID=1926264 RepID=A0AA35Q2K1_9HYPO|nr:unnamed protein product [Clonostachys chloroleuca]
MRSNFLLIATALASTAMATSYNYARGLDADYPELEERDAFSSEEEAAHFLRNIDDDELNALYVRGRARPGARKPMQTNNIKTLIARPRKTRRGIFKDIVNAKKKKPVLSTKPSRAKPSNMMNRIFGGSRGLKHLPIKKKRRSISSDISGKKQRFRGPGAAAARRQRQFRNTKLLAGTPKKIPRRG